MNQKTLVILVVTLLIVLIGVVGVGIFYTSKNKTEINNKIINIETDDVFEIESDPLVTNKDYENMTRDEQEVEKEKLLQRLDSDENKYDDMTEGELEVEKEILLEKFNEPDEKYDDMTEDELEKEKEMLLNKLK
jgi:hypothetical protein